MSNDADIEIYVKNGNSESVLKILTAELGPFRFDCEIGKGHNLYLSGNVKLLLNEEIQGGYLGVWLRGPNHWKTDVELARFLSKHLRLPVRCDPGSEYPEVSPYSYVFLEISNETETLVEWG